MSLTLVHVGKHRGLAARLPQGQNFGIGLCVGPVTVTSALTLWYHSWPHGHTFGPVIVIKAKLSASAMVSRPKFYTQP